VKHSLIHFWGIQGALKYKIWLISLKAKVVRKHELLSLYVVFIGQIVTTFTLNFVNFHFFSIQFKVLVF